MYGVREEDIVKCDKKKGESIERRKKEKKKGKQ